MNRTVQRAGPCLVAHEPLVQPFDVIAITEVIPLRSPPSFDRAGGPAQLASLFIPTGELYSDEWRKSLECHELHASVPNRPADATNGTNTTNALLAAPPSACVHSMHTGVQLVTRTLACMHKGHILLS